MTSGTGQQKAVWWAVGGLLTLILSMVGLGYEHVSTIQEAMERHIHQPAHIGSDTEIRGLRRDIQNLQVDIRQLQADLRSRQQ